MRILIADKNRDFLSGYRKLLAADGYETETAFDGTQVLEKAAKGRFDLVLLSEKLPRIDSARLTQYFNEEDIPAVILSERREDETREAFAGKQLKIAGVLCFPFEPQDMRRVIEHFSRRGPGNEIKEGEEG